MIDNSVPIPISVAKDFAVAMKKLSAEGGYIKLTEVNGVMTYMHSASKSGKMTAKEIVATATAVAKYAGDNITLKKGLSGAELRDIQVGMGALKGRISRHHQTLSWFKSIFIGDKYSNLATQVENETRDYKQQIESLIKDRPSPNLTNESIVDEYLNSSFGETLNDSKNGLLTNQFKKDNNVLIKKLREFDSGANIDALISENSHLTAAQEAEPSEALLTAFETKVRLELTTKCQGKNLSDVARDTEFKNLISKYRQTFPRKCEDQDGARKDDVTLVREITDLETFKFEFVRKNASLKSLNEGDELAKLPGFLETASKGISRTAQSLWKGSKKLVGKAGRAVVTGTKKLGRVLGFSSSSKAHVSEASQNPPITEQVTQTDSQAAVTKHFKSLVIEHEEEVNDEARDYNRRRDALFNTIVNRCGISFQDGDPRPTTLAATTQYIQKSMLGCFIGQKKTGGEEGATGMLSTEERMKLEGENTIAHMFYMYQMLLEQSVGNTDPEIAKLKNDLERSLYFAFESVVVGGNGPREDILAGKIHEELSKMKPGERLFLPIGCAGHATLLMMTKTAEGRVEVQHFNTGLGLDDHDKLAGDKSFSFKNLFRRTEEGFPIAIRLQVDLNRNGGKDVKDGLAYFINTKHFEDTTMEDVTRGFEKLKEKAGVGEIQVSVRRKHAQQIGNCSYRCLLEGFRDALGVNAYRDFKVGLIDKYGESYENLGAADAGKWTAELTAIREKTLVKKQSQAPKAASLSPATATSPTVKGSSKENQKPVAATVRKTSVRSTSSKKRTDQAKETPPPSTSTRKSSTKKN